MNKKAEQTHSKMDVCLMWFDVMRASEKVGVMVNEHDERKLNDSKSSFIWFLWCIVIYWYWAAIDDVIELRYVSMYSPFLWFVIK